MTRTLCKSSFSFTVADWAAVKTQCYVEGFQKEFEARDEKISYALLVPIYAKTRERDGHLPALLRQYSTEKELINLLLRVQSQTENAYFEVILIQGE